MNTKEKLKKTLDRLAAVSVQLLEVEPGTAVFETLRTERDALIEEVRRLEDRRRQEVILSWEEDAP